MHADLGDALHLVFPFRREGRRGWAGEDGVTHGHGIVRGSARGLEVDINQGEAGAVGLEGLTVFEQPVAILKGGRDGVGGGQRDDTVPGQGVQFASVGFMVFVLVLPDFELGKARVAGIDGAVVIAVEGLEPGEALPYGAAEQFGAVVDAAVAIGIQGEETVFTGEPAGTDRSAGVEQVEGALSLTQGGGVDAVAIEIQHQRAGDMGRKHGDGKWPGGGGSAMGNGFAGTGSDAEVEAAGETGGRGEHQGRQRPGANVHGRSGGGGGEAAGAVAEGGADGGH